MRGTDNKETETTFNEFEEAVLKHNLPAEIIENLDTIPVSYFKQIYAHELDFEATWRELYSRLEADLRAHWCKEQSQYIPESYNSWARRLHKIIGRNRVAMTAMASFRRRNLTVNDPDLLILTSHQRIKDWAIEAIHYEIYCQILIALRCYQDLKEGQATYFYKEDREQLIKHIRFSLRGFLELLEEPRLAMHVAEELDDSK